MKTKETNPTRPGSPTPCKQTANSKNLLVNYSIALKGSKSQMSRAEVAERFLDRVSDYCEPEFEYLHEG